MFKNARKTYSTASIERFADPEFHVAGDNRADREEYRRIVAGAMRTQLPPKLREAIRLYYYEGLGIYQISEICGVHPSTVSRRLAAGRTKIRKFAQGYLECKPQNRRPES